MSRPSISRSLAVAVVLCATPVALRAQARASVCTDGTTSIASVQYACVGHGGINTEATLSRSREPGSAPRTASFPTRTNAQPRRESASERDARLERAAQAQRVARARREANAKRVADAKRDADAKREYQAKRDAQAARDAKTQRGLVTVARVDTRKAATPDSRANTRKVAKKELRAEKKAARDADKQGAYGRCRDGSYTKEKKREKACKSHGGVAK